MSGSDDHATGGHVEEVGAQERERRGELLAELQILGEMASTESALFHQVAAAKYGLGITDMKTLGVLLREGPMTAGHVARRLSLTTGAVTNLIDRLERQDLVKRVADPKDRRKVIVTVNYTALASGENVYLSMGEAFNTLHESYTTEQLEFLARYHRAAIELTKQEIAKLSQDV